MEHYVTLFDGAFLPQGLALYRSMERHAGNFNLWILCVDRSAFDTLTTLNLTNARLILAEDVETEALRQTKGGRSRAEYCWTLTPYAPRFVFHADPTVMRVTYVDADFWLFRSPRTIFEELEASGKAVLITEHAYAPKYDLTSTTGRYCVQFITFVRELSEPVRGWWEERCTEWCFARLEGDKFGDQKYLDDWSERFSDYVHVLNRPQLIVAPWNAIRFPYGTMVAYHFHGLRILSAEQVLLAKGYDIPRATLLGAYGPYLQDLSWAIDKLTGIGHQVRSQGKKPNLFVQFAIMVKKAIGIAYQIRPIMVSKLPERPR